jgi:hypothetical protein
MQHRPCIAHLSLYVYSGYSIQTEPIKMTFPSKTGSAYEDSIVSLVLLPLVWVFVCTRIYVRGFAIKQFGWDDTTTVLATVSSRFTLYSS